ncbi:MAG: efflux RND transporter permease subunit, partial [Bacteroidia bacterium]|nr:efflux RND transporter permease subunit [Bacteroidia bacterium]
VIGSVSFGVLTTVAAFSTFLFLEGRLGDFIGDMAIVVIVTLLISLVEAAFVLPAHMAHSKALRETSPSRFERAMNTAMETIRDRIYLPALNFCLKRIPIAPAAAVGAFLVALGAIAGGLVKTTFFPNIERDEMTVALEMPAGTPETVTRQRMDYIERAAQAANLEFKQRHPQNKDVIIAYQKKIGPGTHRGSLELTLLNAEERVFTSYEITDAVRQKTGFVEGAQKLTFGLQTPFGKPISIALMGNDLEQLEAARNELKAELSRIKALKDVTDNYQDGPREIVLSLKDKAYLLGLTLDEVTAQVRRGFFGEEVQRLQRGSDEVKIWVRYEREDRSGREKLERMRIRLPDGREFPLDQIARLEIRRGVLTINHLDGKREIRVEADVADPKESVTDIVADIKSRILPPILSRYKNVSVSFEGQGRTNEENMRSFAAVGPAVLLIFFSLIFWAFKSLGQTAMVAAELPFALVGVTFGHWLHGLPLSILSFYGVLALVGVMVNDSIVFIERYNQLLQTGMRVEDAVREAGRSRFRAIVLTTVTTVAGLYPLILERSFQAQFLVPMAVSMAYGLMFSTLVTLLLLPCLIIVGNRVRRLWIWAIRGRRPSAEEVEPAVRRQEAPLG